MRDGMIETQDVGMQAKPADDVVAVAIFHIAANGMPHVGRMHANLILAPCLQTIFYQRI